MNESDSLTPLHYYYLSVLLHNNQDANSQKSYCYDHYGDYKSRYHYMYNFYSWFCEDENQSLVFHDTGSSSNLTLPSVQTVQRTD